MNSFKKKKPKHNYIPYTLQIFFQRQGYARLCLEGGVEGRGGGRYMHDVVPLADTSLFFLRLTKNMFFPCVLS
jgi:hypothetical protein